MCLQFIFGGLEIKKCTTTNLQDSQLCGMIHGGKNFVLTNSQYSQYVIRHFNQCLISNRFVTLHQ